MDHAMQVEDAVKRFYSSGNNEIHNWLLQVQASKEAWTFVWQLLDPSKSGEVQYFAANALHEKISKQWEEVPKSDYLDLRNRLFEVLKHPGTSTVVLTKLCQALAAFSMKSSLSQSEERQREKCIVEELVEMLPYNSPETVGLLLRVLEAIPTEVRSDKFHNVLECNRHTNMTEAEQVQWMKMTKQREIMIRNWRKTACFLEQIFLSCSIGNTPESEALYLLGVECTLSWLRIGQLPLDTIGPIYPHLLLSAAHFIPKKDDLEGENRGLEAVQDCLTMVVTHSELYKLPQLFWHWGKGLICMVEQSGAQHYYEILTAFGEAHSRNILLSLIDNDPNHQDHKRTSQQLIEFLLQCSEQEGRYPVEEKRSCIPFGFWYALQDDMATLDPPLNEEAAVALKPIYARLAHALLKKSTLPSLPGQAGNSEDRELFRCYRQDVADTLIYCYNVIQQDLFIMIGQQLSQPQEDVSKWPEVEAAIHAFKALCDICTFKFVQPYTAAILDLLLSTHIPYQMYPREVLCSACSAIGDYAVGIAKKPEYLERALQLVILGLTSSPETAPAASMALKDICRECDDTLAPLAPSLLETISQTLNNFTSGGGEGLRLMYAASKLLKTLPTHEEQVKHLEATIGRCLARMRELCQLPVKEAQQAIINELKMVTIFFSNLEGPITNTVLQAVFPIFEGLVYHPEWGREEKTMEAVFTCLHKALPVLDQPKNEVERLTRLLNESYKKCPIPVSLNFLKTLVTMFGRSPETVIVSVFSEINNSTLRSLVTSQMSGGSLSEFGDLLEAYLGLLAKVCVLCPRFLLLVPDEVPEMLRIGMACLLLPEMPLSKAAASFLKHAISQSPHLQTFIQPIGQELIHIIVHSIADLSRPRVLEPFAEVLLVTNKACSTERMTQWLKLALQDYPMSDKVKTDFMQSVLRERINYRRMCDILQRFKLLFQEQCAQQSWKPGDINNYVNLSLNQNLYQFRINS
ncbi:importin-13 isoform X2 [Copidosoma floridanum]|uniref:importin-13 isoform X2 n=1 Tax=Copidosoma floridanum TaxID=29053 RepID=UPI0006C95200|nr:importin-13 isoform X2 [Copidosoma floridanum]